MARPACAADPEAASTSLQEDSADTAACDAARRFAETNVTSITLTDEQLDRLAAALADRVADRLVQQLADGTRVPSGRSRLVSAGELAEVLACSRWTIYQHADALGGVRIGDAGEGKRPRLRFDVDQALERWSARVSSESSQPSDAPAPAGQPRRRRQSTSGSGAELLPVKGRTA